jgi:hypothetical protein
MPLATPIPPDQLPAIREECVDPETGAVNYEELLRAALAVVLAYDPTLDLSTLRISAGADYDETLAAVSKELGVPAARTKRESGSGVAMLVHGGTTDVLVTSLRLIETIFETDPQVRDVSLNTLHHEMCHAHDAAVLRRTLPQALAGPTEHGWSRSILYPLAHALWSEFSANRRSFATLARGECLHAAMLAEELPRIERNALAAVDAFRIHQDVGRLLADLASELGWLFALLGYVLGTASAAPEPLEKRNPEAAAALRASFLRDAWAPATEHLERLSETAGAWADLRVFAPLEETIRSALRRLGLVLGEVAGAPRLFLA